MQFQEILQEHNIPFKTDGEHQHSRKGWINFPCPFCGYKTDEKYHAGYLIDRGLVNCWRCGPHSVTNTLISLLEKPYYEVKQILETIEKVPRSDFKRLQSAGRVETPSGLEALRKPHRAYLFDRGLDPEMMKKLWRVQGIGLSNELQWRVWIPVYYKGELVNWTTRSIGESGSKYISAEPHQCKRPLKSVLFGEDYCRNSIVITEGPFDVFKIGPGAVATFGVNYSSSQLFLMSKYPIRVVCFDSEEEAQKLANKLFNQLSQYPGETFNIVLESGGDPGDASKEEIEAGLNRLITFLKKFD